MQLAIRVLASCSICLSLTGTHYLSAAVITVPAIVEGDIHTGTTNIEDALDVVNISLNRVGILEFDLAAQIPAGSTILSATFRGYSEQVANNPSVDLLGYEATTPAAITLADASVTATHLLSVFEPTEDADFGFSFPTVSSLQSALDGSGVFGLRAVRTSEFGTWRIRSVESDGPFPRLEVEYVPEPSTLALASLGMLALMAAARQKVRRLRQRGA